MNNIEASYKEYLNFKLEKINRMLNEDFYLYSEEDHKNLINFMSQFHFDLCDIIHKNFNTLIKENKIPNILQYTGAELLDYLKKNRKVYDR